MAVNLRDARAEDREHCNELLAQLTAATGGPPRRQVHHFDELLTQERGQILLAEEDGTILGMATVSYNLAFRYPGEYCQLEELIVSPDARGKNVGGLLIEGTIDNAKRRGCSEFGLYLIETTEKNRPFYEKYGFRAVGTEMRQTL